MAGKKSAEGKTIDIMRYLKERSASVDAEMEKIIPHKANGKWAQYMFGTPRYAYDTESIQGALNTPIWDLLDRGGKRWRPVLMLLTCEAVGGNAEKVKRYTAVLELIHNGTLMVDDVQDHSELRREKPCTYKIFGVDITVNAGNFMYYAPYALLTQDKELDDATRLHLHDLIAKEMICLHAGQGLDIYWHRGHKYNVSEKEYLQMCAYKTGMLARMSTKMGAVLGKGNAQQVEKLGQFGETIGVAFQIQDDVLNLVGEKFAKGKGVGEDIHEGKRTLMVLHALNKATEKDQKRLVDILNAHPSDEKTIREAIAIIQKYGGIDYARTRARELMEQSWKDVEKVLPEGNAKAHLRAFAEYLIQRDV